MKRWLLYNLVFLVCFTNTALAQRVQYMLSGGSGFSFVSAKQAHGRYSPVHGVQGGVSMFVPIVKKLTLETGLTYERRGFRKDDVIHIGNKGKEINRFKEIRNYITVPLQLNYEVLTREKSKLLLGGGMNYGFLFHVRATQEQVGFHSVDMLYHSKFVYFSKIGLTSGTGGEYFTHYMFDSNVEFNATYLYKDRYVLRGYYNYSLYDAFAPNWPGNAILNQHNAGMSLGIMLR